MWRILPSDFPKNGPIRPSQLKRPSRLKGRQTWLGITNVPLYVHTSGFVEEDFDVLTMNI